MVVELAEKMYAHLNAETGEDIIESIVMMGTQSVEMGALLIA